MEFQGSEELVVYAGDTDIDINERKLEIALSHSSGQVHGLVDYQVQLCTSQELRSQQQLQAQQQIQAQQQHLYAEARLQQTQAQLYANQQLQAQQQQIYTEARVQQARMEAEARTEALEEMIRATRIDPAAVEHHVNSKLQSAIQAANDAAQTEARAVAEAHSLQNAQVNGIRIAQAFEKLEARLHGHLEKRLHEVLAAHVEQVRVEIEACIAKQGEQILKSVERQIKEVEIRTTTQLEFVKTCAEKKAKSIVRLHHAEESSAHKSIRVSLLAAMEECKASAVASATQYADDLVRGLTTLGNARLPIPDELVSTRHLKSRQEAGGDSNLLCSASSEGPSKPSTSTPKTSSIAVADDGALVLAQMFDVQDTKANLALADARRNEQQRVATRALERSHALVKNKTTKGSMPTPSAIKKKTSETRKNKNDQIQSYVKRRSEERKELKKKRIENTMKLAQLLVENSEF